MTKADFAANGNFKELTVTYSGDYRIFAHSSSVLIGAAVGNGTILINVTRA